MFLTYSLCGFIMGLKGVADMGAIVHIPETLDVICQHNHDGTMIPLKIRLIDEDGEYQSYLVKSYRCTTPDYTQAHNYSIRTFEVVINAFGRDRTINISYSYREAIWRLYGKDCFGFSN